MFPGVIFVVHSLTAKIPTPQLWTKRTKRLCPDGTELASEGDCCPGKGLPIPVGCMYVSRSGSKCTYTECDDQYEIKLQMTIPERSEWKR